MLISSAVLLLKHVGLLSKVFLRSFLRPSYIKIGCNEGANPLSTPVSAVLWSEPLGVGLNRFHRTCVMVSGKLCEQVYLGLLE